MRWPGSSRRCRSRRSRRSTDSRSAAAASSRLPATFATRLPARSSASPGPTSESRPGGGGTQRLARPTTLGFAKALILTGRTVDADEALERGLVNAVTEPEELLPRAIEGALQLAAKSPLALEAAKEGGNPGLQ